MEEPTAAPSKTYDELDARQKAIVDMTVEKILQLRNKQRSLEQWIQGQPPSQGEIEAETRPTPPQPAPATSPTPGLMGRTQQDLQQAGQQYMQSTDIAAQPARTPMQAVGEHYTGLIPGIGEYLGTAAGQALVTRYPWLRPAAGAIVPGLGAAAAAGGVTLENYLKGRSTTPGQAGSEALKSVLPQALQTGYKAYAATPLRRKFQQAVGSNEIPLIPETAAGKTLRGAEQLRRAQVAGPRLFDAPTNEAVDAMFAQVRASGQTLDTAPLVQYLKNRIPGDRKRIRDATEKADALINERTGSTDERKLTSMLDQMIAAGQPPPKLPNKAGFLAQPTPQPEPTLPPQMDIGDVQNLRSGLRQRIEQTKNAVEIDTLQRFKDEVDNLVLDRLTPPNTADAATASLLLNARKQYHRLMASEEFADFLKRNSTTTGDGKLHVLHFGKMQDALWKDQTGAAQRMNRYFDQVPGARDNFHHLTEELSKLSRPLEIETPVNITGVDKVGFVQGIFRSLSENILLSRRGVELFLDVAKQQQGRITPNALASILNTVRRELQREGVFGAEAQQDIQGTPLPEPVRREEAWQPQSTTPQLQAPAR